MLILVQAVSNYMLSDLIRLPAVMKCTLCDKVASLTHLAGGGGGGVPPGFLLAHFKPSTEKDMTHLGLA